MNRGSPCIPCISCIPCIPCIPCIHLAAPLCFLPLSRPCVMRNRAARQQVVQIGDALKALYAYSYQVLPFIYTHLVSLSCTIFLLVNAFLKGMNFHPESSYTFGLFLPAAYVLLTTLTVYGLLEVGVHARTRTHARARTHMHAGARTLPVAYSR